MPSRHPAHTWFSTLSPTQRALVLSLATIDVGLRSWALVDVSRRSAAEVRGRKLAWVVGLSDVSSGGVLPAVYLLHGRRPRAF